jgi:hypothetical protein
MIVHSFSRYDTWFPEYARFVGLFGREAAKGELHYLNTSENIQIFSAWISGDTRFLAM